MKRLFAVMALATSLVASNALAVPTTLQLQGHLANAGAPTDGDHIAVFTLFDSEVGGAARWAESDTLHVTGQLFSVVLGRSNPLMASLFNQPLWVEVSVDGSPLSPRLPMTSAPYSQWAQRSDTATVALSGSASGGQWETDGANVWRASGKIGVGTSSPDQRLGLDGMLGLYPRTWVSPTTKGLFLLHNELNSGIIYAFDYPAGRADTLGMAAAAIAFDTYSPTNIPTNRMWISQDGKVGLGTAHPEFSLDLQTTDPDHGFRYILVGGPWGNPYVTLGMNNGRGALFLGSPSPYNVEPADNAALLQTTGGWQWNKQLNIMGNVGIGTNAPAVSLHVAGNEIVTGNVTVGGSLAVTGTKCRAVQTGEYGALYFNAVESAQALFSLEGEGRLSAGTATVRLDPKWLAGVTVDERHPLQVWITFYGPHGSYYVTRAATHDGFSVIDPDGSASSFGWKVEARQKGFEDLYLDQPASVANSRP